MRRFDVAARRQAKPSDQIKQIKFAAKSTPHIHEPPKSWGQFGRKSVAKPAAHLIWPLKTKPPQAVQLKRPNCPRDEPASARQLERHLIQFCRAAVKFNQLQARSARLAGANLQLAFTRHLCRRRRRRPKLATKLFATTDGRPAPLRDRISPFSFGAQALPPGGLETQWRHRGAAIKADETLAIRQRSQGAARSPARRLTYSPAPRAIQLPCEPVKRLAQASKATHSLARQPPLNWPIRPVWPLEATPKRVGGLARLSNLTWPPAAGSLARLLCVA